MAEVSKGRIYIKFRRTCAYRILCDNLDWLNLSSGDSNKVGICWLCRSRNCMRQQVLDDATSVQSTTKYYSSPTPYYKVLRQYYSLLQSPTPYYKVLLQYYSSTTPYYKVLLQYFSQSTTPFYKVLLQYCSVLTIRLCTTKYYSGTSLLYKILPLPWKVTLQLHQVLHLPQKVTWTIELHQVLHLPQKVTLEPHQLLHLPR